MNDTAGMHRAIRDLRQDVRELRGQLDLALDRIGALERQTPAAQQAQYEADLAEADLAGSGYGQDPPVGADRHGPGCLCPYCPDEEPEPEEHDPGPEVDDEGGMSEYRYATLPGEELL